MRTVCAAKKGILARVKARSLPDQKLAMPYRRSSYAQQGTRGGRRPRGRRRTSVSTRARYQRPSAKNQRSQIRSLAKIALANRRLLNHSKSYTDWYLTQNTTLSTGIWNAVQIMDPVSWQAGNRQSSDFLVSQNAYIRNLVFEWFASSELKEQTTVFDIYLVTLRQNAANWQPAAGPSGALTEGNEYENMGGNNSVSLNSGVFRVIFNKQLRLFPRVGADSSGTAVTDFSGNPFSVYRQGKVNIRLGYKIRAPAQTSWKTLSMATLPPTQKLWLIYRAQSFDQDNNWKFNFGCHFTAIGMA